VARIGIDRDEMGTAFEGYQLGHDTQLKGLDINPPRADLRNFRREHTQARIAAGIFGV